MTATTGRASTCTSYNIILLLTFHLHVVNSLTTPTVAFNHWNRPNKNRNQRVGSRHETLQPVSILVPCLEVVVATTTTMNMVDANQSDTDTDGNSHDIMLLQHPHIYKFITNRMCPYAQKVWMALEVLEIPYTMVEIPLYGPNGKPDWFLQYNPKGTVPVLVIITSQPSSSASGSSCSSSTGSLSRSTGSQSSSSSKHERILTSSDEILHVLFQEEKIAQDRPQWIIQQQQQQQQQLLLLAGKAVVLNNNPSNLRALHDVLHHMEEQWPPVNVPKNTDYEDETMAATKPSRPSMVDCCLFPFVWRLQIEFQWLDSRTYPNLYAWYQDMETNRAVQATMPAQWWWWW